MATQEPFSFARHEQPVRRSPRRKSSPPTRRKTAPPTEDRPLYPAPMRRAERAGYEFKPTRTLEDVLAYLKQTQSRWRTKHPELQSFHLDHVVGGYFNPQFWPLEAILQDALRDLKSEKASEEQINYVRSLIHVVSWRLHDAKNTYQTRVRARQLAIDLSHTDDREQATAAVGVAQAIQDQLRGEAMEDAAKGIETLCDHAWHNVRQWMNDAHDPQTLGWPDLLIILSEPVIDVDALKRKIQSPYLKEIIPAIQRVMYLRPIRDFVYHRRLT